MVWKCVLVIADYYILNHREVLHYDDVMIPLTLSDVEAMEGKSPPTSLPGTVSNRISFSLCEWLISVCFCWYCAEARWQNEGLEAEVYASSFGICHNGSKGGDKDGHFSTLPVSAQPTAPLQGGRPSQHLNITFNALFRFTLIKNKFMIQSWLW